jgi:Tfp pilus assembly protein PilN
MRPVNLIPPDERRGDSAPLRTGNLVYVLVAGLGLLLLGIVAVALTTKQISDHKSEKASLEQQLTAATAQANSVKAFTDFRTVQQNRQYTVNSLAQSRFDWQRVLEELARVLPSDVTLTTLKGTVAPTVQVDTSAGSSGGSSAGGSDLRAQVAGPALEINGCATGNNSVAGFLAALEDIDGVTRVALGNSKGAGDSSSGFSGEPGNAALNDSSGCSPGPDSASFSIVVAFDKAPTPAPGNLVTPAPATPAAASVGTTSNDQVSDGQSEENVAKASVREQTSKAESAVHTVLKGGN